MNQEESAESQEWGIPPVRLGLSGRNSGNFLERPRKGAQSFSWNSLESTAGIPQALYFKAFELQASRAFLFNGDPVEQDLVAKSTCEAELIAASEAAQQGENISIVIAEMTNACCEIEVSSDNAAALHMVRNGSETAWRTRHISVKALWLHQMSRRGIRFSYQSTSDMAADSLTKGLGASRLPKIMEDLCPHRRLILQHIHCLVSARFQTISILFIHQIDSEPQSLLSAQPLCHCSHLKDHSESSSRLIRLTAISIA